MGVVRYEEEDFEMAYRVYGEELSLKRVASRVGMSASTLWKGFSARRWEMLPRGRPAGSRVGRSGLFGVVRELRDERRMTFQAIGDRLGFSRQRAHQIYSAQV